MGQQVLRGLHRRVVARCRRAYNFARCIKN
jgi:hypothetical protein